jgi:hypothetical protein
LTATGTITGQTDVVGASISLKGHEHEVGGPGTNATIAITSTNAVSGSPVTAASSVPSGPGSIVGKTGKPS